MEAERMTDNQSGVKVIAWRRLIRRRIAWAVIAVSSALLVGLALWVYVIDPWYEAKSEITYRDQYRERWEAEREKLRREGRLPPDY